MVDASNPTAVFGKKAGGSAYQVIEQHEAFDAPEITAAFRKICTSFEWKHQSGVATHSSCYGMLRVDDDRFLIATFQDAGRDAAGRPHTLRIDCQLTSAESLRAAWASLTSQELPTPIPASNHLVIIGDPSSYSTSL
ncbi:MAG: hypothetical protein ACI9UA_001210 [Pseudoalteromonas tetraodonis]|jgi:hypothetical protein